MGYLDPKKQRAAQAESYRRRYEEDPEFREKEAQRKAEWYRKNRERCAAQQRMRRQRIDKAAILRELDRTIAKLEAMKKRLEEEG